MRGRDFFALVLGSLIAGYGGGGGGAPAPSSLVPLETPPAISGINPVADADWPTFQHDMQRTGYQPSSPYTTQNASTLKLNWGFNDGARFVASPIVYQGTVYVVDDQGQLTAWDASSGSIIWQRQVGIYTEQTPAIYDGMLFIGNYNIPSLLYALDPKTGATLWQTTVPGGLKGSPVVVNGTLYEGVGLGDPGFCSPGGIYAFSENSGTVVPGVWLTNPASTAGGGGIWSPLSYDGQRIYFGTGNVCNGSPTSANAIVALNPATNATSWSNQTANPQTDDDVGTGVAMSGSIGIAAGKNGTLYNFDLASGRVNWTASTGSPDGFGPVTIPTIGHSTILVSAGVTQFVVPTAPGLSWSPLRLQLQW